MLRPKCACGGRHFACSGRHFACGGRHFACCGLQGSWGSKKLLAQEIFFTFLKIFLSFLGFSRVKIHFFQKVLKKWSSFRKKLLYFFPLLGGGGPDPKVEISTFYFYFFWTLPYKTPLVFNLLLKLMLSNIADRCYNFRGHSTLCLAIHHKWNIKRNHLRKIYSFHIVYFRFIPYFDIPWTFWNRTFGLI